MKKGLFFNTSLIVCFTFALSKEKAYSYSREVLKHKDLLSSVLHSVKSAPNGEAFAYWWPANWSLDRWDPAVQIAHNRPNVNAVYNISSLSLLRILDLWIEMKLWRLQMISDQKRWSALTKWSYPFSSPPIPFHSDCHLFALDNIQDQALIKRQIPFSFLAGLQYRLWGRFRKQDN